MATGSAKTRKATPELLGEKIEKAVDNELYACPPQEGSLISTMINIVVYCFFQKGLINEPL
ncbi:MAG TPA: hypothetical protein ACFYD6_02055 [Candidatus Brocadiia bacterium]|nr:hypothetical protein [Planctomycetota bacterium]MDO8094708.1 hypothetical protein [Candidatus Brocadiales bacterium]